MEAESKSKWNPPGLMAQELSAGPEHGIKGWEKLFLGSGFPRGRGEMEGGWSMGAKPLGRLLPSSRLLHPHLAASAGSGSFEVMHGAVCLVFPAPENRKQQ